MRQAGILAAAGLVALQDGPDGMIDRLAEDHGNARLLAEGLANLDGIIDLDPARVRTNYVLFRVRPRPRQAALSARAAFMAELRARDCLCIEVDRGQVRALTHHGVEKSDIKRALETVRQALLAAGLTSAAR
jgi:threonine aldolase